jgi:hypothetical protein
MKYEAILNDNRMRWMAIWEWRVPEGVNTFLWLAAQIEILANEQEPLKCGHWALTMLV